MLKILKSGQQQQFLQAEIREEENVVLDDGIFFFGKFKSFSSSTTIFELSGEVNFVEAWFSIWGREVFFNNLILTLAFSSNIRI